MDFKQFKDIHAGKKIIVSGCASSALALKDLDKNYITIGVNDLSMVFHPTYLVILDEKNSFVNQKACYQNTWQYVESTLALKIFTQLTDLEIPEAKKVLFEFAERENTNFESGKIGHTGNSPYVACLIAAYMGATKIGLIGVDFTEDRISGKMLHDLRGQIPKINEEYNKLGKALKNKGIELVNLSTVSKITSLPLQNINDF